MRRLAAAALLLLGAAAPDPAGFAVRGIDVSHHQGAVDWAKVAKSGVAFVFVKASEGATVRDRRFVASWDAAGRAGLERGAYHYFSFCAPGAKQAANFLAALPPTAGALPPVADVEFVGNCTSWKSLDAIRAELAEFLRELERAWHTAPIVYTSAEAHGRILDGHLELPRLWLRSVDGPPPPPLADAWTFWQHSDTGRVPGIAGRVDLNVFRGTVEELRELRTPGGDPAP